MILKKFIGIATLALFLAACSSGEKKTEKAAHIDSVEITDSVVSPTPQDTIPGGVRALLEAYPEQIKGFEEGNLIMADGTKILYDDGREKGFEEMLDNSSPKDMFYVKYQIPDSVPAYLADAGRSRSEQLFKAMYGSDESKVRSKLVAMDWFGEKLLFTSVNGAAEQLKKAAAELVSHPELSKYLKSSGTFYWRNVRGAKRLSAHSYGIAIDLGVANSDYWLWKNPGAKEEDKIRYVNRFPKEIARIMQKYGFVWGGSWYHFDTMHFEYRPELLRYAETN